MKVNEKVKATFVPLRADGTPVLNPSFADKPDWSGGTGFASLLPTDDGMSCEVDGVAAGEFDLEVIAMMNTSAGPKLITGTTHIPVTPADVVVDPTANDPVSLRIVLSAATAV